jgi:hypothetical protein
MWLWDDLTSRYTNARADRGNAVPEARSGPTIALREIGVDLMDHRSSARLTRAQATQALRRRGLRISVATLSRYENAITLPKPKNVSALLALYGVDEQEIEQFLVRLAAARRPGWWHEFRDVLPENFAGGLDLEQAAVVIRCYAPGVVPDLLQTPEYAEAALRGEHPTEDDATIKRRVELLLARQRMAFDRPRPLRLWALMEEAALTRVVGGREVMRQQLDRLDEIIGRAPDTRKVQVLPGDRMHPLASSGHVEVVRLNHPRLPDHVVTRSPCEHDVSDDIDKVRACGQALDYAVTIAPYPGTLVPAHVRRRILP